MRTRPQFSGNPMLAGPCVANAMQGTHRSVLLHEAIELLDIKSADAVVDATLGGAGHAHAMAELLGKKGTLIGFDLDHDAIERASAALVGVKPTVHLVEANFRDMSVALAKLSVTNVDKVLFDLGWSSFQLDAGRGFSLKSNEPLLMTYSKNAGGLTAATIVNEWKEESLADVIFGWGEERYSRRIAKAIVERREQKSFTTADELVETIVAAVPPRYRFGKIHPATRTFQALRIAVNDELGALADGLKTAWEALDKDGRIAVITFHSIEDRIVKQVFRQWEEEGSGKRITRKPIAPSPEEVKENPRARSAKLRVIQKI